jgi:hypothetical protein
MMMYKDSRNLQFILLLTTDVPNMVFRNGPKMGTFIYVCFRSNPVLSTCRLYNTQGKRGVSVIAVFAPLSTCM